MCECRCHATGVRIIKQVWFTTLHFLLKIGSRGQFLYFLLSGVSRIYVFYAGAHVMIRLKNGAAVRLL